MGAGGSVRRHRGGWIFEAGEVALGRSDARACPVDQVELPVGGDELVVRTGLAMRQAPAARVRLRSVARRPPMAARARARPAAFAPGPPAVWHTDEGPSR